MLRSMNELEDYAIAASDGSVGKVKDFLFDDSAWVIRYFVVETGTWLSSRKVLISPIAIQKPNWQEKTLPVLITKEQVNNSPDIDTDKPVSRQHEIDYLRFYGYPNYWGGAGLWAGDMYPFYLHPSYNSSLNSPEAQRSLKLADEKEKHERHQEEDPNLRSCKAVIGYHIHATDGDIGHVSGLLVEEGTWAVRYLIVDTSNWWVGHKVLISPEWIDEVRWHDNSVSVELSRQWVKDAPKYHSTEELNRKHEGAIYQHYGRTGYWPDAEKIN
jgi:hypothetical protein